MQKTIKTVFDKMNDWKGEKGDFKFIDGEFEDGLRFSYMAKPDNAAKVQEELKALIGKPGDFTGEEKTDNQGRVKFRLKDYPGKVKAGGFGGGAKAPYQIAWANTKEGQQFTTASIQAQVALKAAVEIIGLNRINFDPPPTPESLAQNATALADHFFAWLTKVTTSEDEIASALADRFFTWLTKATPEAAPGTPIPVETAVKILSTAPDEALVISTFKGFPEVLQKNDAVKAAARKRTFHLREIQLDKLINEMDFLSEIHAFAKRLKIDVDAMRIKADPEACGELIKAMRIEQEQRAFAN